MKIIDATHNIYLQGIISLHLLFLSIPSWAFIPEPENNNAQSGDTLGFATDLIDDFLRIVILIVGVIIFISVGYQIFIKFIEWRKQKAEFSDFMNVLGIGFIVVLVAGFLLFTAFQIIEDFQL